MRVHYVKARKDWPQSGIKKGEMHYTWSFYRQPAHRSKNKPTRAMLTQNELLITVYNLFDGDIPTNEDDIKQFADDLRQAGEDHRQKKDELPENFQNGEQGQGYDDRADACDSAADEIEAIDLEGMSEEDIKQAISDLEPDLT